MSRYLLLGENWRAWRRRGVAWVRRAAACVSRKRGGGTHAHEGHGRVRVVHDGLQARPVRGVPDAAQPCAAAQRRRGVRAPASALGSLSARAARSLAARPLQRQPLPPPRTVVGGGDNKRAVVRKGDRRDGVRVRRQHCNAAPGAHLPQPQRLVEGAGHLRGGVSGGRVRGCGGAPRAAPRKRKPPRSWKALRCGARRAPHAPRASWLACALKLQQKTKAVWPTSWRRSSPLATCHTPSVRSSDAVAR